MWVLKFTFILLGVIYELVKYAITRIYNAINKIITAYLYKTNKNQA
jgi:hypothetical protein